MSIMTIDLVCPQAILPMKVTLVPSGILCVPSIPAIYMKDTLFCSELNLKHAVESFISLPFKGL